MALDIHVVTQSNDDLEREREREKEREREREIISKGVAGFSGHLLDLLGQFSGWSQDEGLADRFGDIQVLEDRDGKGSRLPSA